MKSRLFESKRNNAEQPNLKAFSCLDGNDVISARISDHHPVIHNGVIFWNVMMKCEKRASGGYNNGFGKEENDLQYIKRLFHVIAVLAEIVLHNPSVKAISLCEGPVKPLHVKTFLYLLKKIPILRRFINYSMVHDTILSKWGLMIFVDKKYEVTNIPCHHLYSEDNYDKLINRFQLWKLRKDNRNEYFAFGHFPFGGDEHLSEKSKLSVAAESYIELVKTLLKQFVNEKFIICADYNFNPYLISECNDRFGDKITTNNSIVLSAGDKESKQLAKTVTVDGILLSKKEKQFYLNTYQDQRLFSKLVLEHHLFGSTKTIKQHEHDSKLGLVCSL